MGFFKKLLQIVNGSIHDAPEPEQKREQIVLTKKTQLIYNVAKDGRARSLQAFSQLTGLTEESAGNNLRKFRSVRMGSHIVKRTYKGNGVHLYCLVQNPAVEMIPYNSK